MEELLISGNLTAGGADIIVSKRFEVVSGGSLDGQLGTLSIGNASTMAEYSRVFGTVNSMTNIKINAQTVNIGNTGILGADNSAAGGIGQGPNGGSYPSGGSHGGSGGAASVSLSRIPYGNHLYPTLPGSQGGGASK